MKVDITLRDLNADEAAAILIASKAGGASLALFLASPGGSAMKDGPAFVAAVQPQPSPAAGSNGAGQADPMEFPPKDEKAPAAAQQPQPAAAKALPPSGGADLEKWSRYTTTKAVVKSLIEEGVKDRAAILARCLELRAAGVAPLKAVPEDSFADRVGSAVLAILGS